MNKEELETLEYIDSHPVLININDLTGRGDRTLLYGYDCNRNSWHVYIYKLKIYGCKYAHDGLTERIKFTENSDYVPNKRLHPECCDYEFCCLLKRYGVYLPFTQYQEIIDREIYYGKLLLHC